MSEQGTDLPAELEEYFNAANKVKSARKELNPISSHVPFQIASYIEEKITQSEESINFYRDKRKMKNPNENLGLYDRLHRQALKFYEIKAELSQTTPQYDKLKSHLDEEFEKAEKHQETLQAELKQGFDDDRLPNGTGYFDLREKRLGVQEIEKSLTDATQKAFLEKIDKDWGNQQQGMKRGQKLIEIGKSHGEITKFQQLRQLMPASASGVK